MILDLLAIPGAGALFAYDLHQRGHHRIVCGIGALLASSFLGLSLYGQAPTGTSVFSLLAYALGSRLARFGDDAAGQARLVAGIAAGMLAGLGPIGTTFAFAALASALMLALFRPWQRVALDCAVVAFVPVLVLSALGFSAFIETGSVSSVTITPAGAFGAPALELPFNFVFPGAIVVFFLAPWLALPSYRRTGLVQAALAIFCAGAGTALAFGSVAPLASGVSAALVFVSAFTPRQGAGVGMVLGLAGIVAIVVAFPVTDAARRTPTVLLTPWRIGAPPLEDPPAWGVRAAFAQDHPGILPRLERRDGRYVYVVDTQ